MRSRTRVRILIGAVATLALTVVAGIGPVVAMGWKPI